MFLFATRAIDIELRLFSAGWWFRHVLGDWIEVAKRTLMRRRFQVPVISAIKGTSCAHASLQVYGFWFGRVSVGAQFFITSCFCARACKARYLRFSVLGLRSPGAFDEEVDPTGQLRYLSHPFSVPCHPDRQFTSIPRRRLGPSFPGAARAGETPGDPFESSGLGHMGVVGESRFHRRYPERQPWL